MALSLIGVPTEEPITLIRAKQHCRIDLSDEDALVLSYITAARTHIETYLRRALITQIYELSFDNCWPTERIARNVQLYGQQDDLSVCHKRRIRLSQPPIQSVTSITYIDQAGSIQTLESANYIIGKSDTGEWVIDEAYGVTWPSVQMQIGAIKVQYIAGYGAAVAVPEPIKIAMLMLIGHWYNNREAVSEVSMAEVPFAVEALLFPYRVFY